MTAAESQSMRVLRMIEDLGIVDGRRLHHELGIPYDELVQVADLLMGKDLIDVKGGDPSDPRKIAFTHFAYRPSAEAKVKRYYEGP